MGLSASPTRIRSAQETMRKKASRPSGGSPFVFFGVTLSAQSDFLNLGGSELEGPDSLPLLILHLCDCNRSVGVVTVVLCAAALSRVVVPSVCFTPWSGVRIPLTTAPASLPCTPLFVAMRHLPPTGGILCSLAAVSSAAIPVRVKLKIPRANAAAATTLDIPSRWDLQQRRPRPVADAGRSCWGSGQQDARAAQGTRGCWEPQPGALSNSPLG